MCFILISGCTGGPAEKRIIRALLEDYEPTARPVQNYEDAVPVKLTLTLTQLQDLVSGSTTRVKGSCW